MKNNEQINIIISNPGEELSLSLLEESDDIIKGSTG